MSSQSAIFSPINFPSGISPLKYPRPIHKIKHPKIKGEIYRLNSDVTELLNISNKELEESEELGWKNSNENINSMTSTSIYSQSKFKIDKKKTERLL